MTVALWYWRYGTICVEIFYDEDDAASCAVSMEENGEASIAGVQYEDKTYIDRGKWKAYSDEEKRRSEEWEVWREGYIAPRMKEIEPPFYAGKATALVEEDTPEWVGK